MRAETKSRVTLAKKEQIDLTIAYYLKAREQEERSTQKRSLDNIIRDLRVMMALSKGEDMLWVSKKLGMRVDYLWSRMREAKMRVERVVAMRENGRA